MSNMDPLCRCSFFHFIPTNDMGDKKYLTVTSKAVNLDCEGEFKPWDYEFNFGAGFQDEPNLDQKYGYWKFERIEVTR